MIIIDNMGPKGIGPQKMGVGLAAAADCGCGIPKECDCDSPVKLAPLVGMVAKKVLVDKIAEKASPGKKRGCKSKKY